MPPLSPKEKRFLTLYYQGKSYKDICAELDISLSTAKTLGKRILVKTLATCLRHAAYQRRKELEEQPAPMRPVKSMAAFLPIIRMPAAA